MLSLSPALSSRRLQNRVLGNRRISVWNAKMHQNLSEMDPKLHNINSSNSEKTTKPLFRVENDQNLLQKSDFVNVWFHPLTELLSFWLTSEQNILEVRLISLKSTVHAVSEWK